MLRLACTCCLVAATVLLPRPAPGQDAPSDTLACTSFPFEAPFHAPPEASYDVLHADLSVDVGEDGALSGRAALDVQVNLDVEALFLASAGATVDSVVLGTEPLTFDVTSGDSLRLALPDTMSALSRMRFVVYYRSRLQAQAPGLVHAIDPFETWYPGPTHPHDRFTSDLRISVPTEWSVAATGIPTGQRSGEDGRLVFEFSSPHALPARRIGFAAGFVDYGTRFAALPGGRRPVLTWWLPRERASDRPRAPEATIPHVADRMAFLSSWTGIGFPFERYTQLHLDGDPASSSSLARVPPYVEPDGRTAEPFQPHASLTRPLIQQWFGSLVSAASWEDAWLEDAFPAYLDLFSDDSDGPDEGDLQVLREAYLRDPTGLRPLVWRRWNHPSELSDLQTAARGAWVLHMLRRRIGEEAFRNAVHRFLADNEFEAATTADWISAVEAASDRDVSAFADTWIYAGGHPNLAVSYAAENGSLRVRIEQVQSGATVPDAYALDLELEVGTLDDTERFDVRVEERVETVEISFTGSPRYLAVDPAGSWLLESRVDQSASAWVAQLRQATTPAARLAAARALGESGRDPALLLGLRSALEAEQDAGVRAAIIEAIGRLPHTGAAERALTASYDDASPRVRRAVLSALSDTPAAAQLALQAAETDPHYEVQAEAVRTVARIGAPNAVDLARAALVTPSRDDVIRAAGLDALARLVEQAEQTALEEGMRYASEVHARRLRIASVHLLGRLAAGSSSALDRLAELLGDPDADVARAAAEALQASGHEHRLAERLGDISQPGVSAHVRARLACP